jgi:hypothetical protein
VDLRVKELVDFTKERIGLEDYYLHTSNIYWEKDVFNTEYTLTTEWFPNILTETIEEGSNPKGTAVVELELKTGRFKRIIFVGKTTQGKTLTFDKNDANAIIEWIEQETGLLYKQQFKIKKQEGTRIMFQECFNGTAVSPSGFIDIELDHAGRLVLFSIHGAFLSKELFIEEEYTLTFDHDMERLANQQLIHMEFPSKKEEKILSIYALDEIYVTNDKKSTLPFEAITDFKSYLRIEQVMRWDSPLTDTFVRQEF